MAKTKHLEGTEECPTHIIIMSDIVKADICKQHQSQHLSRHFLCAGEAELVLVQR